MARGQAPRPSRRRPRPRSRAARPGRPSSVGELACWRRRAGIDERSSAGSAEPYAAELAGEHERGGGALGKLGCPYEAALALAGADDEAALRRSLDELQRLGAEPAAAIVARRLRERGARGCPAARGQRPRRTRPA